MITFLIDQQFRTGTEIIELSGAENKFMNSLLRTLKHSRISDGLNFQIIGNQIFGFLQNSLYAIFFYKIATPLSLSLSSFCEPSYASCRETGV
jgi:hypothetical protein